MEDNMKESGDKDSSSTSSRPQMELTEDAHRRLDYALCAARLGIPVVPLRPMSKAGVPAWNRIATTDTCTIERWLYVDYPNCNFGLIMGQGWMCLDLDRHGDAKDGVAKMAALCQGGFETFSVKTPGNGMHHYFQTPGKDYRRYTKGNDGIDVLGNGGFVAGPCSVLEDGKVYTPLNDWSKIRDVPANVVEALSERLAEHVDSTGVRSDDCQDAERPVVRLPISLDSLSDTERTQLERTLAAIDASLPYDSWYRVIFAVLNDWQLRRETIHLLGEWSSQSRKWDAKVFDEVIASYRPGVEKQLSLAFLWRTANTYPTPKPLPALAIRAELRELADSVANRHCATTIGLLQSYGSNPSVDHTNALALLSNGMVKGLFASDDLRIAFPLETGMGKTTSVIALCKTIHDMGLDKSLLIACERIDQLSEIRDALIANGISKEQIGLIHKSQDYRSIVPPDDINDARKFRFLLACHQRIKLDSTRGSYPERLMEFGRGKRDLVVWDESLIGSQGHFIGRDEIAHGIGTWLTAYELAVADKRATEQFQESYEAMKSFFEAAKRSIVAADDEVIQLASAGLPKEKSAQVIRNIVGERTPESAMQVQRLVQLVEYADRGDVRVVRIKGDHALLQFEQTIDPAFNKVVILDASCNIRHLATYDPKLRVQPLPVTKRYSKVEIRWVPAKASRSGFVDPKHGREHFQAYVEHLRRGMRERYNHDSEGLIFCHQEHKERVADEVERAKQQTAWGVKPIHVLHWGQHRASNRYKDARWTVLWGVQYLPRSAIAAAVVGQTGRLDYAFLDREIDALQESEIAESIYQAISRGNSRNVQHGEAGAQLVDLVLPEREMRNIQPLLEHVMPGVKIKKVEPDYFAPKVRANAWSYIEIAESIAEFLKGLPGDETRIAKRKVNEVLQLAANASVYRNAEEYLSNVLTGWRPQKRSYVRIL